MNPSLPNMPLGLLCVSEWFQHAEASIPSDQSQCPVVSVNKALAADPESSKLKVGSGADHFVEAHPQISCNHFTWIVVKLLTNAD